MRPKEELMTLITALRTRPAALLLLALGLTQWIAVWPASAAAGNASGPSALALAAVVASHSSVLGSYDRRVMARLFGGHGVGFPSFPPNRKISVTADSIKCRVSDVDLAARSCELAFKGGKRNLTGREANELFATVAVAGVMSEGAAGSIFEAVTKLACTIDPNVVKQKDGGGADCTFETE
jgi:hypothetical protein